MGFQAFSKSTCNKLEQFQNRFLWGGNTHSKSWIPITWSDSTRPYDHEGSLNIRPHCTLHKASLAKTIGWFISQLQALWVRVLTQKYLCKEDLCTVLPKLRHSSLWKNLLKHRHIIFDKLMWDVGDGAYISMLQDIWIPGEGTTPPFCNTLPHSISKVSNPIISTSDGPQWNETLLRHIWDPLTVDRMYPQLSDWREWPPMLGYSSSYWMSI